MAHGTWLMANRICIGHKNWGGNEGILHSVYREGMMNEYLVSST